MKRISFLSLSLLLLAGCSSDNEPQSGVNAEQVEIKLTGGIQGVEAGTRAPVNSTFSADLNVNFVAINQASATYPNDYTGLSALTAAVSESTGHAITFSPAIYYQASGESTKLIGWYPNTGTLDATAGKVTFSSIDGDTDIMVTPLQEGSKNTGSNFGSFTFGHVLTQIRVFAKADNTTSAEGWGNITSITVVGKKQDCILAFPATTATAPQNNNNATTTFGTTTANLPLISKHWDTATAISAVALSTTSQPCGYAMFAPQTYSVTGTGIKITVVTSVGGPRTIELPQTLLASTAYDVTLSFTQASITPSATISTWATGTSATIPVQ